KVFFKLCQGVFDLVVNTVGGFLERVMEIACCSLHVLLHLAQLFKLDFTLDITFDIIDVTLGTAYQMTDCACNLGQSLRTDHNQGDNANDQKFAEADVKQSLTSSKATAHHHQLLAIVARDQGGGRAFYIE